MQNLKLNINSIPNHLEVIESEFPP